MKRLLRLLFLSLPCLLLGCDYGPSGSNFKDINPDPEVIADITLHEQEDTVVARGNLNLFFKLFLPGREFYGHKLELDGKLLSESTGSGGYYFESEKFTDGYHVLKYSAYANSGTGSLADRYRAEMVVVSRTWVVLVDNASPAVPVITSIKPEDGQLRISWKPFKGRWFKSMELRRQTNDSEYRTLATFSNPNDTTWLDNSYIGGLASYNIVVHLEEKQYTDGTAGPATSFHHPLPALLSTTYNAANEATLTFSSTPFYKNFEYYHLSTQDGHFTFQSYEVKDTVKTFPDPGFGKDFYSSLATKPKNINYHHLHERPTSWFHIPGRGKAWGPYHDALIQRSVGTDRFYVWNQGTLHLVDATTMEVLHKRDVGATTREANFPQGAFSVNGRQAYLILNNDIHQLDPATLRTTRIYKLRDLLPYVSYYTKGISVSNDNRLLIASPIGWDSGRDTVYVVDMNTRKLLTKIATDNGARYAALSPDGKAMRVYPYLYAEQPDGTWQPHTRTSNYTSDFRFHPTKPWYTVKEERMVSFYSIQTGAKMKTLTTETTYGRHEIDPASGYLYENTETFPAQRHLHIYNIETGQLVRKLKLAPDVTAFVYKDRIFSPERYIPL
ncbi:YncE family protein [Pontibacter roseus]|uniref:YncE family protein n=1 Tax=Pontibacter roseus TaxID=336989 RepID=UPI0003A1F10A|nr:hypothetical protein [Pontibacter roseus]